MAKAVASFVGKKNLGGVIVEGGSELDVNSDIVKKYTSFFELPEEGDKEKAKKEVLNEKPVAEAKVEKKPQAKKPETKKKK